MHRKFQKVCVFQCDKPGFMSLICLLHGA